VPNSILKQILAEAKDQTTNPSRDRTSEPLLAVFDLDSTLLDLTVRVKQIVLDFVEANQVQTRFPAHCQMVKNIEILRTDWGLEEPFDRIKTASRLNPNAIEPEALEAEPDFFASLQEHWRRGFFSNDYLHHDQPIEGALEFVRALELAGAKVVYLTGRDFDGMLAGTLASLQRLGFLDNVINNTTDRNITYENITPHSNRLFLKPDARQDDGLFKAFAMDQWVERHSKIWIFENEPVNINRIHERWPDLNYVLLETAESKRETPKPRLHRIKNFVL
jgi:beta-phosphoglucomutase-like phosphatase (HAD superfamily)